MIRSGCEVDPFKFKWPWDQDYVPACDYYAFSKTTGWTKCRHDKSHCCAHESSRELSDSEISELEWIPHEEYVASYPPPLDWITAMAIPYHFSEDYGKWLGPKRAEYPPMTTVKEPNGD